MSAHLGTGVGIVAIVALVVASAFFSSSETAIFTLPSGSTVEALASDDPRAATLATMRSDPHRLLVTILVGNNIVNVAISSITTVVVLQYLSPGLAVTVATVTASFVVLICGEIVPKSYGLARAPSWALTVARPLAATGTLLYPVVVGFDLVTGWLNRWVGAVAAIEQTYQPD